MKPEPAIITSAKTRGVELILTQWDTFKLVEKVDNCLGVSAIAKRSDLKEVIKENLSNINIEMILKQVLR